MVSVQRVTNRVYVEAVSIRVSRNTEQILFDVVENRESVSIVFS